MIYSLPGYQKGFCNRLNKSENTKSFFLLYEYVFLFGHVEKKSVILHRKIRVVIYG